MNSIIVEMGGDSNRYRERALAIRAFAAKNPKTSIHAFISKDQRLGTFRNLHVSKSEDPLRDAALAMMEIDGTFLTAGNTGKAVLALHKHVGRIVKKPPILCSVTPKIGGSYITCDVGGGTLFPNLENVLHAARCGEIVAQTIFNKTARIGLFNVGEEYGKGGSVMDQICDQLKERYGGYFLGNVEPNHAMLGAPDIDVLATTGFIGNTFLKSAEASLGFMKATIKQKCRKAPWLYPLAWLANNLLFQEVSWQRYSGAYLVGLNVPVIITHGRSDKEAFYRALTTAASPKSQQIFLASQKLAEH